MKRLRHLCIQLVVLVCLLTSHVQGQEAPVLPADADASALTTLAREFFTFYSRKDMSGWLTTWSRSSPNRDERARAVAESFAKVERMDLRDVSVAKISVAGDKASLRVNVRIEALDKTGKPIAELGRRVRVLSCVKEGPSWMVWREFSVAQEIAEALASLTTENERSALLTAEEKWITPELSIDMFNQGVIAFRRENFAQAIALHDIGRRVAAQFGQQALVARSLSHIGMALHAAGDYSSAFTSYEDSLKIAQTLNLKPGILANLNNLANVYAELGNYDAALTTYNRILDLAEAEGNQANVVIVLNNLANVYVSLGNNVRSLECLRRALELTEKSGSKVSRAISLNTQAWIFFRQGNDDLAESYFQQSMTLLKTSADDPIIKTAMADTLSSLGKLQKKRGRYEEALRYYRESLALREGRSEVEAAHELVNIGDIYRLQGRYPEALQCYEQSLLQQEKWNDREGIAITMSSIASLDFVQGRHADALRAAERSSEVASQVGNRELLWRARLLAGTALEQLGRSTEALRAFEDSITSIEELWLQAAGGARQQQQFFQDRLSPYHGALRLQLKEGRTWEALRYAERGRARSLLEVLQSGRASITKSMTAAERERERRLTDLMISYNTQKQRESLRVKPDEARLRELERKQREARFEYEAFETSLFAARPELRITRGQASSLTQMDAAALISNGQTALLEYVVTDDRTWLFVLTGPNQPAPKSSRSITNKPQSAEASTPILEVFQIPIGRRELSERTSAFRELIARHDMTFRKDASELYRLLVEPARAMLAGKTRLIIVPDASLWELPFQALPVSPQRFLIEDAEISYAPSLTVLREMMRSRGEASDSRPPNLVAFGSPMLDKGTPDGRDARSGAGALPQLVETEKEIRALSRLYGPGSKVFRGVDATESTFKKQAAQSRVLHIATHGILNDTSPMYSQLVFSQTKKDSNEDGLVEAWELMQIDLQADLVVLSACETARGAFGGGEGALGLAWALFVAGSPATVASQWKVDSASTTELMLAFHRQLCAQHWRAKPQVTTAGALRAAATSLLRQPQYKHPFYWAGFVLIGDGH